MMVDKRRTTDYTKMERGKTMPDSEDTKTRSQHYRIQNRIIAMADKKSKQLGMTKAAYISQLIVKDNTIIIIAIPGIIAK